MEVQNNFLIFHILNTKTKNSFDRRKQTDNLESTPLPIEDILGGMRSSDTSANNNYQSFGKFK